MRLWRLEVPKLARDMLLGLDRRERGQFTQRDLTVTILVRLAAPAFEQVVHEDPVFQLVILLRLLTRPATSQPQNPPRRFRFGEFIEFLDRGRTPLATRSRIIAAGRRR